MNQARAGTVRTLSASEAKAKVLQCLRDGMKVVAAMDQVGRTENTYLDWRKHDKTFAADVDRIREVARAARARGAAGGQVEVPDFPEFCETYLNMPMPLHHLRVWDLLNGRLPRDLHPAMRFDAGRPNRVLLNFPPFHAKTQVWSTNYAVWRMVKDPNVRIAIVSKTQGLAKKILFQIESYLRLPQYAPMHAAFMPEGGWKGEGWTKTEIYLAGADAGHKDPTVQALGLGGQIYGARLDVVILDDLVDSKNVHSYKEIVDYVSTEVASRVDENGVLHCLGTRMAPNDIYSELRDLQEWDGNGPVWTYFAQPAVLEMGDHPDKWTTLWPESSAGNGMYLAKARAELRNPARWELTYQQGDASFDQVFPTGAVMASVDNSRATGPMDRLYCVLGVDPASAGKTAMIVMGVDMATGKRYILDGFNMGRCPPDQMIEKIKSLVTRYGCKQAVIEKNGFQGFLTRSEDLRQAMYAAGCVMVEHQTGQQKWDESLGIQALAPLFLSCAVHNVVEDRWEPTERSGHLISLPNPKFATFVDELITQLTTWEPKAAKRGQLTDLVMALWFANIGVQKQLDFGKHVPRHAENEFTPRAEASLRAVVNLQTLREEKLRGQQAIYAGSAA